MCVCLYTCIHSLCVHVVLLCIMYVCAWKCVVYMRIQWIYTWYMSVFGESVGGMCMRILWKVCGKLNWKRFILVPKCGIWWLNLFIVHLCELFEDPSYIWIPRYFLHKNKIACNSIFQNLWGARCTWECDTDMWYIVVVGLEWVSACWMCICVWCLSAYDIFMYLFAFEVCIWIWDNMSIYAKLICECLWGVSCITFMYVACISACHE